MAPAPEPRGQHVDGTAGMASQAVWFDDESAMQGPPTPRQTTPTPTPTLTTADGPAPASLSPTDISKLQSIITASPDSGSTPWPELKSLLLTQLSHNIHLYLSHPPSPPPPRKGPTHRNGIVYEPFAPRGPPSPHSTTVRLEGVCGEEGAWEEEGRIRELMEEFDETPPFTLQRLVELLLNPFLQYRQILKYLRAITRVLLVTPSFSPLDYLPSPTPAPVPDPPTSASAFQLASTPLFSPIPFLEGKDLPTPPPPPTRRRSISPPHLLPRDFAQPRRTPPSHSPSPRGTSHSQRGPRRGGARIATSSAAMSAQTQTRRRSSSLTSSSSPPDLSSSSPRRGLPPSFHIPPPGRSTPKRPDPTSTRPSPKSPPAPGPGTGAMPTRVDELDNPDAHKTMLPEPVALSSVTTGTRETIRSPPLDSVSLPAGIRELVAGGAGGEKAGLGLGLDLGLGERFVRAQQGEVGREEREERGGIVFPGPSSDEKESEKEGKEEEEKEGGKEEGGKEKETEKEEEGEGEKEGEEGEVERMVSEEREMEGSQAEGGAGVGVGVGSAAVEAVETDVKKAEGEGEGEKEDVDVDVDVEMSDS